MMLFWESVLELEECIFNVAIHGSFESEVCIVPVKVNADVSGAVPVGLHGVVVLECFRVVLACGRSSLTGKEAFDRHIR